MLASEGTLARRTSEPNSGVRKSVEPLEAEKRAVGDVLRSQEPANVRPVLVADPSAIGRIPADVPIGDAAVRQENVMRLGRHPSRQPSVVGGRRLTSENNRIPRVAVQLLDEPAIRQRNAPTPDFFAGRQIGLRASDIDREQDKSSPVAPLTGISAGAPNDRRIMDDLLPISSAAIVPGG
jgi:hypothetical protein